MPRKRPPLDFGKVKTYPLRRRRSIVRAQLLATPCDASSTIEQFVDRLPDVLAARGFREATSEIARRLARGKRVVLGIGAHPIKVGLSPLIIDLMQRGVLSAIAMNGAAIIHDFELAYAGQTSEDVAAQLADGRFGMAEETGQFLNQAIRDAQLEEGLGHAVGRAIIEARLEHENLSILAAGYRLGIPITVHVALGTDIIHMHPSADGAAIGESSLRDFRRLTEIVAKLGGGAFINLGSAVILPEVFVKALNLARNLGCKVDRLLTVDMDFLRQYRPQMNVVQRPTIGDGRGYHFTGHHEIMFPLLCAALIARIEALAAQR